MTVKEIISIYSNHPTIQKIKNFCAPENKFDIPYASTSDIFNKIMKSFDVNKAKGSVSIPSKFVKMSANVTDSHLANIINNDISLNTYSKHSKTTTVRPIFSKKIIKQKPKTVALQVFQIFFFEIVRTIFA